MQSLVREKGVYDNVAGMSKSAFAEEVKRIKSAR
jgi:hypothetical protein